MTRTCLVAPRFVPKERKAEDLNGRSRDPCYRHIACPPRRGITIPGDVSCAGRDAAAPRRKAADLNNRSDYPSSSQYVSARGEMLRLRLWGLAQTAACCGLRFRKDLYFEMIPIGITRNDDAETRVCASHAPTRRWHGLVWPRD